MASISKLKDGRRLIQFYDRAGKRQTIRLGKVTQRAAEAVKVKVEDLVSASITGHAIQDETAHWVASRESVMTEKLAVVGLIAPREVVALAEFLDRYIASRTDLKSATITVMQHTRRCLVEHFGADKPVSAITESDADTWRAWLKSSQGLADNTIRRRCGIAKQFFKDAQRSGLIQSNPFEHLRAAIRANRSREYFVSVADAETIIEACPDAEWRLIFGLSRYAGLRCPSETLSLRWEHIDLARGRMTVPSPKTAHHPGGASRLVPIFPELRPLLEDAHELAPIGAEYVITRYRETSVNLRTQLTRIIKRAGVPTWDKLFHNLRATRETELMESFPAHVVCAWIGNSQAVAQRHYLQVTDEHFERGASCSALRNALQNTSEPTGTDANAGSDDSAETPENTGEFATIQADSDLDKMAGLGDIGLEPTTSSV